MKRGAGVGKGRSEQEREGREGTSKREGKRKREGRGIGRGRERGGIYVERDRQKVVEALLHFYQKSDGRHVGFLTLPCRMYDTLIFC